MNRTNLIPLYRQTREARAARIRAWSWGLGVIALGVGLAGSSFALTPSDIAAPSAASFSKVASDMSGANKEAASLRVGLAAFRERIQSRQFIVDQPDYGLLLGLLSQVTGDEVVLNHCELAREATRPEAAAPDVLRISGFARTQPSVAAFMIGLEGTGIFQSVTLVRSSEQPLLGSKTAGFQIQCVIGPGGKGGI